MFTRSRNSLPWITTVVETGISHAPAAAGTEARGAPAASIASAAPVLAGYRERWESTVGRGLGWGAQLGRRSLSERRALQIAQQASAAASLGLTGRL